MIYEISIRDVCLQKVRVECGEHVLLPPKTHNLRSNKKTRSAINNFEHVSGKCLMRDIYCGLCVFFRLFVHRCFFLQIFFVHIRTSSIILKNMGACCHLHIYIWKAQNWCNKKNVQDSLAYFPSLPDRFRAPKDQEPPFSRIWTIDFSYELMWRLKIVWKKFSVQEWEFRIIYSTVQRFHILFRKKSF